ncbi:hypothetical protein [Shimia sp. SDUM112013]|uniref:hypothetical protein n=1 Tax=Shimia sp. SDUM112013 TaxID=3136160 RepID=UPI0032EF9C8B
MIKAIALASGLALSTFGVAWACGFHNYAPKPGIVDQMLSAERIVLARADTANPFRYAVTQVLHGPAGDAGIPFLVDSTTRQKLSRMASDAVLFVTDPETGDWKRIAYVDSAMAPVLESILTRLPAWRYGGDLERFQMFADLVRHPDRQVRTLALRELDQADYAVLSQLSLSLDVPTMAARLGQTTERDLTPIRILLLGFSEDPLAQEIVQTGMEANLAFAGLSLGPFATAYVEAFGVDAVGLFTGSLLAAPNVPMANKESLIEALAIHRQSGDLALGHQIITAVEDVLDAHPELAPLVARQFGARHEWAFRHALAKALHAGTGFGEQDRLDVADYLAFAGLGGDPLQ